MPAPFWSTNPIGYEGPLYSTNPETLVILGGKKLPGLARIKALPSQQADIQKVNGKDGATIILRGYLPGPIEIEVLLWTPEQWAEFQKVLPTFWRKPGKLADTDKKLSKKAGQEAAATAEQQAVSIEHPYTAVMGIAAVVVTGVALPEEGPVPQSRVIRLKCIEHVKTPASDKSKATRKIAGVKQGPALAKEYQPKTPEKNSARTRPSATDGGPNGPPSSPPGGSY